MAGGGGKGGKGGGSSGSVDVDVTSTSSSVMDSDATINSTNQLTSTSNNQIDTTAQATLNLAGLDNIRLRADTTSDSKTALDVDLKPLQVDLCLKVGLDRLPPTRICRPTHERFGVTLFGVEIFGFHYSKEQNTVIEDGRGRPFVAGTAAGGDAAARLDLDAGGVRIRLGD